MIYHGWFMEEVLKKTLVPNVPNVPTKNESPCNSVEVSNGATHGDETISDLDSPVRLVVSLPHAMTETDDRVLCGDCLHLSRDGQCQKWSIVNPHNSQYRPAPDVLRRCGSHKLRTAD